MSNKISAFHKHLSDINEVNSDEIDIENSSQNKGENSEEDMEENDKEMKSFTLELLIHTKVMDNREEIKQCICHNYLTLNENEDLKDNENIYIEKEIIPNIKLPIIPLKNSPNEMNELINIESEEKFYIKLNELTKELKKIGFPVSGSMINVFINYTNNYVYFGTEPLDNKIILYSYMLEPNKDVIKLKIINYIQKRMLDGYTNAIINTYFRKPIKKKKNKDGTNNENLELKVYMPSMTNIDYFDKDKDEKNKDEKNKEEDNSIPSLDSEEEEDEKEDNIDYKNLTESGKRERKIGYIIEKVYAWRKLYNGYRDDNNKFIKYSLDEAAREINVSKKSLDDYLLQIRLGRKCGFNFDDNKNQKIGVLRTYVESKKIKKESNRRKKKKTKEEEKEEKKEEKKEGLKKPNLSLSIDKSHSKSKSLLNLKRNKSKSKSQNLKKNK